MNKRFNPQKLKKLNNPQRLIDIPPEYIWEKLNLSNPESIVDIGSGTAFFSVPFLKLMNKGKVYAADISEIMTNWVKENITPQFPGIVPLLMEDSLIPLEDSSADLVFMINLHHELDEPLKTLAEAYRLLKDQGKICISDWKKETTPYGPSLDIRMKTEDVVKQLENTGFLNISVDNSLTGNFLIIGEKRTGN